MLTQPLLQAFAQASLPTTDRRWRRHPSGSAGHPVRRVAEGPRDSAPPAPSGILELAREVAARFDGVCALEVGPDLPVSPGLRVGDAVLASLARPEVSGEPPGLAVFAIVRALPDSA